MGLNNKKKKKCGNQKSILQIHCSKLSYHKSVTLCMWVGDAWLTLMTIKWRYSDEMRTKTVLLLVDMIHTQFSVHYCKLLFLIWSITGNLTFVVLYIHVDRRVKTIPVINAWNEKHKRNKKKINHFLKYTWHTLKNLFLFICVYI